MCLTGFALIRTGQKDVVSLRLGLALVGLESSGEEAVQKRRVGEEALAKPGAKFVVSPYRKNALKLKGFGYGVNAADGQKLILPSTSLTGETVRGK